MEFTSRAILFACIEQAKNSAHWPLANALFGSLLKEAFHNDRLRVVVETNDPDGGSFFEAYYDLVAIEDVETSMATCAPTPLLSQKAVATAYKRACYRHDAVEARHVSTRVCDGDHDAADILAVARQFVPIRHLAEAGWYLDAAPAVDGWPEQRTPGQYVPERPRIETGAGVHVLKDVLLYAGRYAGLCLLGDTLILEEEDLFEWESSFEKILDLARRSPTSQERGLDRPDALDRLLEEFIELFEAIAAEEPVAAATEVADVGYYGALALKNELLDKGQFLFVLAAAAEAAGLGSGELDSVGVALDVTIAKYKTRYVSLGEKDDAAERRAVHGIVR